MSKVRLPRLTGRRNSHIKLIEKNKAVRPSTLFLHLLHYYVVSVFETLHDDTGGELEQSLCPRFSDFYSQAPQIKSPEISSLFVDGWNEIRNYWSSLAIFKLPPMKTSIAYIILI